MVVHTALPAPADKMRPAFLPKINPIGTPTPAATADPERVACFAGDIFWKVDQKISAVLMFPIRPHSVGLCVPSAMRLVRNMAFESQFLLKIIVASKGQLKYDCILSLIFKELEFAKRNYVVPVTKLKTFGSLYVGLLVSANGWLIAALMRLFDSFGWFVDHE